MSNFVKKFQYFIAKLLKFKLIKLNYTIYGSVAFPSKSQIFTQVSLTTHFGTYTEKNQSFF